MQFDSNRAWTEAVAVTRANLDVLMAVAGVFFLLPALGWNILLSDVLEQAGALAKNEAALQAYMSAHAGFILIVTLGATLVQYVGYLACTVLLADRTHPTVGEALARALRATPTLLGTTLLYMLGLMLVFFLAMLLVSLGGVAGGKAGAALMGTIALAALLVGAVFTSVRLSLQIPVIMREGVANPLAVMRRSWHLTQGHSLGLFGFFAILAVAYVVISLLISLFVITPITFAIGTGAIATFLSSLVAGVIGAVSSVLMIALLTRIHAQLSDDLPERQAKTFE